MSIRDGLCRPAVSRAGALPALPSGVVTIACNPARASLWQMDRCFDDSPGAARSAWLEKDLAATSCRHNINTPTRSAEAPSVMIAPPPTVRQQPSESVLALNVAADKLAT